MKNEEAAVLKYASGKDVLAQVAEVYGVCATTIWNWVNRAAVAGRGWILSLPREILHYDPTAEIIPVATEAIVQQMRSRRFRLQGRPEEIVQLLSVAKWSHQLQKQLVSLGWNISLAMPPLQFCGQYFGST